MQEISKRFKQGSPPAATSSPSHGTIRYTYQASGSSSILYKAQRGLEAAKKSGWASVNPRHVQDIADWSLKALGDVPGEQGIMAHLLSFHSIMMGTRDLNPLSGALLSCAAAAFSQCKERRKVAVAGYLWVGWNMVAKRERAACAVCGKWCMLMSAPPPHSPLFFSLMRAGQPNPFTKDSQQGVPVLDDRQFYTLIYLWFMDKIAVQAQGAQECCWPKYNAGA